jgi:dTDP-D-glucose 4,6-dehydratase
MLDISRAREKLGFEPRTPFAEGLARTVAWFRVHEAEILRREAGAAPGAGVGMGS